MQSNYLHKHFYEHMFFLAPWVCCSSVGSLFRLIRVCTNIVSVFEVICLHDSTWLPAACKRFKWLKLYIASREQTHDPNSRSPQMSSEWFMSWITMTNGLQVATSCKTTEWTLSSCAIPRLDSPAGGQVGEKISPAGFLYGPRCVCISVWKCVCRGRLSLSCNSY